MGILFRICYFGKYAPVLGDSVGHVVSWPPTQAFFIPPHKRLLNRKQHSFPIVLFAW